MRHQLRLFASAIIIFVLLTTHQPAAAQSSSTFTYQGYLTNTVGPVTATCDFQFSLFNDSSAGSQIGSTLTRTGVSVAQGVFSVQLDFGLGAFGGVSRYLAIAAKCGAEVSYAALSPRQALTVAPYATTAFITPFAWSLNGNAATNPATQFIGTTDNQAFEVRVNNLRALRIEPKSDAGLGTVPNVIAGSPANTVAAGVYGATIAGGGGSTPPYLNLVSGNFGTIGGGLRNAVSGFASSSGGGNSNTASGDYSTVGGGFSNSASGSHSTIGGGFGNTASGGNSTVGGGGSNTASGGNSTIGGGSVVVASGDHSTVSGGWNNLAYGELSSIGGGHNNLANGSGSTVSGGIGNSASGIRSTVSGGARNTAGGDYSYAAGYRAKADDAGAFVWADSQNADIFSPGANTFTVRANGGIWLGTGAAPATMTAGRFIDTSTGAHLTTGGAWTNSSDRALKANFTQIDPRAILDAVAAMPITAWNYTAEGESVKHVGPTAQDFRAAFGLGQGDTSISTVDAAGVALAAIQGLKAENDALKADVAVLKLAAGNGLVLPALIFTVGMLGTALIVTRRRG